jgi:hypothetical protein
MSVPRLTFPPPRPEPTATSMPALMAGLFAALAGAGIWTAVTAMTNTEFGWIAWGVGGLVGFVMSRLTTERSVKLGATAALLAALGLAIGKVATVRVMIPTYGSELVLENEEILAAAFAADMRTGERYSPEVSIQLAGLRSSDSLPPALQNRMMDEAQMRMANAPPAEKERVAKVFTQGILADLDLGEQLMGSLSIFDLLWFGLAISTAFKLMRGS